jgi:hypothetical protein
MSNAIPVNDLDAVEKSLRTGAGVAVEISPKQAKAESRLPPDMIPDFRRLVDEYRFLTKVNNGAGWVAYAVLADLVRAGWRCSATPTVDSPLK